MADKRMFSQTVVDSDAFLDIPLSAQALYFHFGMRADDDGFVNSPRKIQKMVSASEDDVRLLIAKGFVIPFDSGVVVIKHWRIHNTIKSDRYKPTSYQDEKALLHIKPNKAYTLNPEESTAELTSGTELEPNRNQTGGELEPQYRLDKNSLDQARIDQARAAGACAPPKRERFAPPSFEEVRDYMIKYAAEHELEIDAALQAEKFISYHDSRGWISGQSGRKIKRWKGAAGTWMCNLREWAKASPEKNPSKREINWGVLANE